MIDSAGSPNEKRGPRIYLMRISDAEAVSPAFCKEHFPQRYEKALRFRFADDRLRCISAGLLLHSVLGLQEEDIRYNEFGKPFSDTCDCFSLSHSGDYTVLAVHSASIGVDLEQTEQDDLSLVSHIFTDEERSFVGKDLSRFYTLWTLKESLSKAIGTGLSTPVKEIPVLPFLSGQAVGWKGKVWYGFSQAVDDSRYILSLVSESKERPEIVRVADPAKR